VGEPIAALVFDDEQPAVGQLGDEVWVEAVTIRKAFIKGTAGS
jgi:hypothetical protein